MALGNFDQTLKQPGYRIALSLLGAYELELLWRPTAVSVYKRFARARPMVMNQSYAISLTPPPLPLALLM